MYILVGFLSFGVGVIVGFALMWLKWHRHYSGTIHVTHDERRDKILYSLELDDYPDSLQFKKEVLFKVDSPDRE